MGVTLGTYGATDATGWSTFTSAAAIYYISSSTGNDTTGTADDVTKPFLTIAKAHNVAKLAGNGRANWMLLKKTDTFTKQMLGPYDLTGTNGDIDGNCELYGASNAPTVWSSYDPSNPGVVNPTTGGARPIVEAPLGRAAFNCIGGTATSGGDYTAIVGLKLINSNLDPNDSEFSLSLDRSSTIGNAGSGYVTGDFVTLSASNGTTYETAVIKVVASGGQVTGFFDSNNTGATRFNYSGRFAFSSLPTAFTQASTTGGGSGLTITGPVYTRGDASGITIGNPINWFLVEDCDTRYFPTQGFAGSVTNTMQLGAIRLRRSSFSYNYANGMDSGAINPWVIEENVIWHNGHITGVITENASVHNLYCSDMGRKGDPGTATKNCTIRGNIIAFGPSSSQFRNGFTVYDNLFLKEQVSHNWGNATSEASQLYNNVYLEGKSNSVQGTAAMEFFTRAYGDGYAANTGSCSITGNIAANSIQSTGTGFEISAGANNVTATNNIVYNWCPSSTPPNNSIKELATGVIFNLTITNGGSGYVDKTVSISSIRRESIASGDTFNSNYIILTVSDVSGINAGPHDSGCGTIYISGVTGTGALPAALNDKVWVCTMRDLVAKEVILLCQADDMSTTTASVTGTLSTGTVYIPYYQVPFTGGSGSSAKGDLHVKGGAVVACYMAGSTGELLVNAGGDGGSGYSSSDTISASNANLGGSGSGFAATPTLCSNTISGNYLDPTATGVYNWVDPGRTSGSYYTSIGSPGGYSADADGFAQAASENNKATWNSALTANNGINPYIRAGFATGGGSTGAGENTAMGYQSGKVKGRRIKIPHAIGGIHATDRLGAGADNAGKLRLYHRRVFRLERQHDNPIRGYIQHHLRQSDQFLGHGISHTDPDR